MAIYPCDWSHHRYSQQQQSAYVTQLLAGHLETHALRLCPTHLEEFEEAAREWLAEVDNDTESSVLCDRCGHGATAPLFATIYRSREEPIPFAADLCPGHQSEASNALRFANGRVRRRD